MITSRAIGQVLSLVIVIAVILAAFLGYVIGESNQNEPTSTVLSTVTTTSYSLISTTITVTILVSNSTIGQVLTLTEYVTDYAMQTYTVILYSQSSTTYTCYAGTASYGVTGGATSFALENTTGLFTSVTVATVYSTVNNGITTTTITGSYPLTTYATTGNGSTTTITTCAAEP